MQGGGKERGRREGGETKEKEEETEEEREEETEARGGQGTRRTCCMEVLKGTGNPRQRERKKNKRRNRVGKPRRKMLEVSTKPSPHVGRCLPFLHGPRRGAETRRRDMKKIHSGWIAVSGG